MQSGSVIRAERQRGPDVWEFRWREPGADGKRKHRRMVLGSVEQLTDEAAARQAISSLASRAQSWQRVAQDEIDDIFRPCFSLS
jgi:integrase